MIMCCDQSVNLSPFQMLGTAVAKNSLTSHLNNLSLAFFILCERKIPVRDCLNTFVMLVSLLLAPHSHQF